MVATEEVMEPLEDDDSDDEDGIDEEAGDEFTEFDVGNGENDNDTLGLARLQNCCETLSAEARSPGHEGVTHPTRVSTNDVALRERILATTKVYNSLLTCYKSSRRRQRCHIPVDRWSPSNSCQL